MQVKPFDTTYNMLCLMSSATIFHWTKNYITDPYVSHTNNSNYRPTYTKTVLYVDSVHT